MNKPKILMLDQPCEEACKLIDEVAERSKDDATADYVWTGLTPVVTNAPVFSPCTGVDHIQAPEIIHLDEKWRKNEGQQITSTAEHTLSLMLQLAKKAGIQIRNKDVGIIGYGRIGQMVSKYIVGLQGFVSGRDTNITPTVSYVYDHQSFSDNYEFEKILKICDIITLHVPLNDETKHMVGKKEIAMMKPGALLINTSRQEVVDIEAVKEALISKKIYYADDFKDKVDLTEYGAIQTPHIGGNCKEARKLTDIYIAKRLQEYIRRR